MSKKKRQKDRNAKRQRPKGEFNFVMSGQFCTPRETCDILNLSQNHPIAYYYPSYEMKQIAGKSLNSCSLDEQDRMMQTLRSSSSSEPEVRWWCGQWCGTVWCMVCCGGTVWCAVLCGTVLCGLWCGVALVWCVQRKGGLLQPELCLTFIFRSEVFLSYEV